jgi:hypothetical protein
MPLAISQVVPNRPLRPLVLLNVAVCH